MANQNQTAQEPSAQIEAERAALCGKIEAALSQLTEIAQGIEAAGRTKNAAKASYASALDAGAEDLMSEALSRIRQANEQREKLLSSVGDFDRHIAAVQESFSALMAKARSYHSQSETALETCRAEHKNAQLLQDRCRGLLNELNTLGRELVKIKDATSPVESPRSVGLPGIPGVEGNV